MFPFANDCIDYLIGHSIDFTISESVEAFLLAGSPWAGGPSPRAQLVRMCGPQHKIETVSRIIRSIRFIRSIRLIGSIRSIRCIFVWRWR